jgi:predicted permease
LLSAGFQILLMFALGVLFARLKVMPENSADVLNRVVLYLCLPAAVLLSIPRLHFEWRLLGLALTPWLIGALAVGLVTLARRLLRLRRDEYAVLLLCVALGNTGFIGYPVIHALLGGQAQAYAVIYDQFGTFLMLSTYGLFVCARFGGNTPPTPAVILGRIARFPPAWSLLIGLTIMPAQPPEWLERALRSLAEAMLPLVMLAVGFSLRFQLPRNESRALVAGLFLKLLALPTIAWGASVFLFGLKAEMLQVNVLETAMPPMVTAAVLAIAYDLAPRLAAALVGYGILAAMCTLPLWTWLLRT